jgi:hypothetical protein
MNASNTLSYGNSGASGGRALVHGVVTLTPATTTPRPPCQIVAIEQIIDGSTGVTHAYVSSAPFGIPGR